MIAGKWTCNKNKNNMLKHSKMPKHNRFMEYPPRLIANCNRISFLNVKNIVGGGGEIFSRQPGSPPTPPSRPIPPFPQNSPPSETRRRNTFDCFINLCGGACSELLLLVLLELFLPPPPPPHHPLPPPPRAFMFLFYQSNHLSLSSVLYINRDLENSRPLAP